MSRWLWLVAFGPAIAVACGDSPEAAAPDTPDAALEAQTTPTADTGPPPLVGCDPKAPFGAMKRVDGINSRSDESTAHLTPNERVVYLDRVAQNGISLGIFRSERSDGTGAFPTPTLVEVGLDASTVYGPVESEDESKLYFEYYDAVRKRGILYAATRSAGGFTSPSPVIGLGSVDASVSGTYVSERTKEIFFHVPVDPDDYDLWTASFDGKIASAPHPLESVNKFGYADSTPVASADGLSLYFYSSRGSGHTLWMAARPAATEPFGTPTEVTGLSDQIVDAGYAFVSPVWISPDNCRLYVSATSTGSLGDIYIAERSL